jgi:hypothetical protein
MATAAARTDRWTAATLLGMAAVFPAGIVGLYLFSGTTDWQQGLSVAMKPDSPLRYLFPVSIVGAILSLAAAVAVAVSHRRAVLRVVLGLAVCLTVVYGLLNAWALVLVSALPLWWLYKSAA